MKKIKKVKVVKYVCLKDLIVFDVSFKRGDFINDNFYFKSHYHSFRDVLYLTNFDIYCKFVICG